MKKPPTRNDRSSIYPFLTDIEMMLLRTACVPETYLSCLESGGIVLQKGEQRLTGLVLPLAQEHRLSGYLGLVVFVPGIILS